MSRISKRRKPGGVTTMPAPQAETPIGEAPDAETPPAPMEPTETTEPTESDKCAETAESPEATEGTEGTEATESTEAAEETETADADTAETEAADLPDDNETECDWQPDENDQVEEGSETRNLSVPLPDKDRLEAADRLAEAIAENSKLERQLELEKKHYKGLMSEQEDIINETTEIIRHGHAYRDVPCKTLKNFTRGTFSIVRLDTNVCFVHRPLSQDERQIEITTSEDDPGGEPSPDPDPEQEPDFEPETESEQGTDAEANDSPDPEVETEDEAA